MSTSIHEHNNTIFYEMMSHPALFTHPHPNKVMIIDDEDNRILQEVIKHEHIAEIILVKKSEHSTSANNPKVKFYSSSTPDWDKAIPPHSIDILIHSAPLTQKLLQTIFTLLHSDGILIQEGPSPFETSTIKSVADQLRLAGFKNQQILHFPQPSFTLGWRSIIMASKQGIFKRVREKTIYAKPFKTYYYNFDTHRASLVIPEFMREEGVI
jgi:spermidine synthase